MTDLLNFIRSLALALPETAEQPHFENKAFVVKNKIFVTVNERDRRITVKLSAEDQDIFSVVGKGAVFKVPNKWGNHGWTHILPDQAEPELLQDAIRTAWRTVAPKKLLHLLPD